MRLTDSSVTVDLREKKEIKYIFVQEYIKLGQRVRTFDVEIEKDGEWEKVASSTTIGYKKILRLNPVLTSKVRIKYNRSQGLSIDIECRDLLIL